MHFRFITKYTTYDCFVQPGFWYGIIPICELNHFFKQLAPKVLSKKHWTFSKILVQLLTDTIVDPFITTIVNIKTTNAVLRNKHVF